MTEEQEARLGKARGGATVTGAAAAGDDSIATNTKRCGLAQRNVFWDPARTVNVFELRPWFGVSVKPAWRYSRVQMVLILSLPLVFASHNFGTAKPPHSWKRWKEEGKSVWCVRRRR